MPEYKTNLVSYPCLTGSKTTINILQKTYVLNIWSKESVQKEDEENCSFVLQKKNLTLLNVEFEL